LFTSHHISPAVTEFLSTAHVRVVTSAPHTPQIFQVFDLTLFGLLKRRGQHQLPLENDARTPRFIRKVYHDFRMAMTMIEPNIWGAFRGIGVKYSVVYGVQRVSFDEMTLRESEGFKEHKYSCDPREPVNRTDCSGFGTATKTLLLVSTILMELPSPDGSRKRFGGVNRDSPIAIPSSLHRAPS
jgi:hypothetical protein